MQPLPDDIDVAGSIGIGPKSIVLRDERAPKVAGGRVQEPVDRIAGEARVEPPGPGSRFEAQRGNGDPLLAEEIADPVTRVAVQHEPAEAMERGRLPAAQRADEQGFGAFDHTACRRRQPLSAGVPPEKRVGVEEDAYRVGSSSSHASPVEK